MQIAQWAVATAPCASTLCIAYEAGQRFAGFAGKDCRVGVKLIRCCWSVPHRRWRIGFPQSGRHLLHAPLASDL